MTDRGSGFLNFNSLKLNPEITSFSRISSFSVRYFHCRKSLWLFGVLFFILSSVNDAYCQIPWQAGYAYCKKITIKASQIEISGVGSHNNFPVLIDITDNDLRTCSNGGYMENASGYDIRFTTYLGIRLYHDIEGYDPISGRLTAWVRIPSLSKINTDIFLFFGNPSISSNSSSSATWSSNYKAVWHFNNSIANASAFPLVSSDFGSTSTTGKILEGRNFIRTSHQYISVNYNDALDFNDAITVSAWINLVTNDIDQKIFSNQNNISGGYKLGIYTDGKVEFEIRTSDNHPYLNRSAPDGTILSTSTWYYVVGVYSNSEDYIRTYVNGGLDRPMVTDKTAGLTGSGNPAIGRETWNDPSTFDGKFNGIIDELRVQNIARDAGWIKTEFNNQSSPSTFYTVGPTASNPVAVCKPVTLYLDASGNASLTVPMVDNGSSSYCGLVKTLNKYSFSCSNLGENIVTLTVADPFNTVTCNSTVLVRDAIPPVISNCPADISVSADAGSCGARVNWTEPTVSDNCTPTVNIVWIKSKLPGNFFPIGTTQVNYIARDASGNTSTCSFTVTVNDNTMPLINCKVSGQQNVPANTNCKYVHSGTGWDATASDNCTVSSLAYTLTGATSGSGSSLDNVVFNIGLTTVNWEATDAAGNKSQCSFTVNVTDNIIPVVICPPDITHDSDPGMCSYTFTPAQATGTDNCGIDYVTGTRSDGLLLSDPYPVGVTTITWTSTDLNGNTSLPCYQKITVLDKEKPVFTAPPAVTVCRSSDCSFDSNIIPAITGNVFGESDNCTPQALLEIEHSDDLSGITDCNTAGTILRTWKVTDEAGNFTEKVQAIVVEPFPTVTVGNDVSSICTGGNADIVINSSTVNSIPSDFSIDVKVTSTDPGNLSGTAPLADFVLAKSQLPYTINGTLINNSGNPIEVTFRFTPKIAGCNDGSTVSTEVTVHPDPAWGAIVVTPGNICLGGEVTFSAVLNGAAGGSVEWIRSETSGGAGIVVHSPDIPLSPGTYYYRPVYTGGYGGCNLSDGAETAVTVHPDPSWGTMDAPEPDICVGGSVTFSVVLNNAATGTVEWIRSTSPGGAGTVVTSPDTPGSPGTYYYRPVYVGGYGGCDLSDGPESVVRVIQIPQVNQPSDQVVCNGESVSEINFRTTVSGETVTYSWKNDQVSIGLPENGTGDIRSFIAKNNTRAPLIANIEVTPHITHGSFTCDGPSKTFTITVNPTAQVNIPANQVVCNDAPTQPVIFSTLNNDGLTEYEWTNDQTSIGLAASGTGNIPAFTAVNEGDSPVVATITVSPYYTYDGLKCSGPSVTFTITVDPSAKVVPSVLTQTICNDGKTNIIIGSPSTFSSGVVKFDYTVDATGGVTGFTTPVYGLPKDHVIADELHNPTNEAQTVTYTIVPVTSTGCGSGPAIVIVTVLPTPKVIKPADMDLCPDEDSPPVVLTTPTAGSVYFTWENDNPSIGLASAGEGNIPSFTAINETDNFVTATITIIPHITSDPLVCDGDPVSFTIRVDPKPRIIPVPSPTIQCDNTETNIVLQSPSIFTNGQVSFKYTAVSPDGITGFAPFGTVLSSGDAITDRLVNSSDKPGDVIYTITPVSPVGCSDGPSVTVTVTVEPTPRVLPVPLDTDQCNSTATNIRLESPSEFKNGKVSFRYSVTSTGSVTGISEDMTGLSNGYVIKDRLFNSSDAPQTVTYVIVPVSPGGCGEGASVAVKVTVNPTPRIHPVPENTIRCNNTPANIALLSPSTFTSGSVSINLTATAPEGLTGFTAEETGLPSGYLIPDLLANSTDAPLEVTYTLVPVSGVACDNGPSVSFKVTVNPTPRATPVNLKPAICYDDLTEIILLSPTVMTEGSIKFDYSIFYPDGVTGNNAAGADIPEGETLSFRYRNENDAVTSARFVITPRADALSCPEGANVEEFVELHPKPARGIEILKSFTCESSQGRAALRARISSGADPYRIVWSGPVGYYMEDMEEIDNLYAGNYTLNVTDNLGCMNETSFNIANLSAKPRIIPLPKSTGHHVTCPGGNDGVARIYVREGGTPPFRYWLVYNETETLYSGEFQNIYASDDPSTYLLCTDLKAGSYKLIIRDFNGCELTMDAILTEPPPLIINITPSDYSGSNIDCKGYSTGYAVASVSGGNGGYSYYWYPESGTLPGNNTGSRLDGIPAGKYYVRVTDLSGCEQIESIVLTDPPGMELAGSQVSRSPDGNYGISCYGADDGFIKIDIAGGSGNYDFLWVGPDGFQSRSKDISQLKSGVYTCTVTDINGCILMPEPIFTLTQPDKLEVSLQSSVSSHGGFNIDCHGGTGTVETTVSGGSIGNYSYSWTTTNGSGIIDGEKDQLSLSAGSYHLRVSDLNGCNAEKDINLTEPPEIQLKLVPTHITCQSDTYDNGSVDLTVSGGVAPYNYIWSGGQDTQDIANLTEGVYSVTVTDANGCTKEGSVRINLPPPLTFEKILSAYGNFNISCFGRSDGSIHVNPLSGTPPYSYVWQGPDGFSREGNEISGLKAGEYVLLITDSNYCTGSETVTLIEPPGELTIDITAFEDIRCNGDKSGEISIEAVNNAGAVTYLWSDGVLGNSRQGLAAGRYRVIITDSNNCRTDSVIIFTEPEPLMVELDVTLPTCPDMPDGEIKTRVTGGTDGGYSYLWSDNSTDPDLSNATGGLYSIRVTDMNNCSVEKSLILEAKNPLCLEIPNAISPNGDLVNDVWNIHNKELYPAMEVMIFNRWGEMVWKSERGYPRPWDGRSNGRMLPVDSYHYIIDLNNGTRPVIGHVTIVK